MKKGLVSVVIPMFNAENTIGYAVRSVVSQNYERIEIIVVDDGSTDGSRAAAGKMIPKNAKIPIRVIAKENGGVSSARNAGMRAAKGEFIAFLDADDAWVRGKIRTQVGILDARPGVSLVGSMTDRHMYSRFMFKKTAPLREITLRDQIFKNHFQTSTVVIRAGIIGEIGYFDETQRYAEEGNYWIRILARHRALCIAKPLVRYGSRGGRGRGKPSFGHSGLSGNIREMERGELKNIRYARAHRLIGVCVFYAGIIFSLAKYVRRIIIVRIRRGA